MIRWRRVIGIPVYLVVATLLLLEILLRLTDPWGIYLYQDYKQLHDWNEPDGKGSYWLPAGDYQLTKRTFTILPNHTRAVPATPSEAACQVVTIGDSMTFGHGVQDAETWVNLLAIQYPQVTFINAGYVGYTSEHIRLSMARFPEADGFIYFLIGNDLEAYSPTDPQRDYPSFRYRIYLLEYLRGYERLISAKVNIPPPDEPRFWDDLALILATEPILVFGYDAKLLPRVQARYPQVVRIAEFHDYNSTVDFHPNPKGHQFIAEQIAPSVADLVAAACGI